MISRCVEIVRVISTRSAQDHCEIVRRSIQLLEETRIYKSRYVQKGVRVRVKSGSAPESEHGNGNMTRCQNA